MSMSNTKYCVVWFRMNREKEGTEENQTRIMAQAGVEITQSQRKEGQSASLSSSCQARERQATQFLGKSPGCCPAKELHHHLSRRRAERCGARRALADDDLPGAAVVFAGGSLADGVFHDTQTRGRGGGKQKIGDANSCDWLSL